MRQARIQGVSRRKLVTTTRQDPTQAAAPDLVRRNFTAAGPNRIWVADITYVPTKAGFLYLAVVIDLWSRRVVGWSMRNDPTTPWRLRVHRRVLQPHPTALGHRIPLTRRLRKEHPNYPLDRQTENCPQKRGNSTGYRLAGLQKGLP